MTSGLKKDKVLDIGCGNGIITKLLRKYYSLQIQTCDIENYLIDPDILFKKIIDGRLPKYKYKFDFVLLNDVLHHVSKENQIKLIQEAIKVANQVLVFEMKPTFSAKIFDCILNKLHYQNLYTPLAFRIIVGWKSLFKKMRLKSELIIINQPFWYPFSLIAFLIQKNI